MKYFGRFTDDEPFSLETGLEDETPLSFVEADQDDSAYDRMMDDRRTFPGNEGLFLSRVEDEMERARRRAPIREAA